MTDISVHDLTEQDIIPDLAAILGGAADVDGIEIIDVAYDENGFDLQLADAAGEMVDVSLQVRVTSMKPVVDDE